MDIAAKEAKIMSTEKRGDNLHKASSILSVAAILLSIAVFVRMETVVHDTKMMDSKFTLQIQQIKDALDQKGATYQARANDNIDIVSGINSERKISRRRAKSNRQNTNAPQEIGDGIKTYVASTVTDSVQSHCLPPGKLCVAGTPGPKGIQGPHGERGPKDTAGEKGEKEARAQNKGKKTKKTKEKEKRSGEKVHGKTKSKKKNEARAQNKEKKIKKTKEKEKRSGETVHGKTKSKNVPPEIIETRPIIVKVKGDSVASVSCQPFGFPSPSIVWTRGLVPLPQGRTTVKNGTLIISNFSSEDAGNYQCKATNKLGSVTALTAALVYEDPQDFWKMSVILAGKTSYQNQLNQFLTTAVGNRPQWLLCYRASTHGWAASTFHSRCDGKRHTVTIIKKGQYVFGGYTDIPWEFSGGWSSTSNSFIFSLRNKEGLLPSKSIVKNPSHAIYRYSSYGPTFGYGHDIYIANNANSNTNSYTDFGISYSVPSRVKDKQTILAGSLYFTPDEVEVFYLG